MRLAVLLLGLAASACVANVENVVAVDVHFERCDDARAIAEVERGLENYGTWSEDDAYGTVWTPSDTSFVPYATDGRFADLSGDLLWISDVPWGTTLHHGRWVRCKDRWSWVPDAKYAGAWVTLHHDGDRTSWSPSPPTRIWRRGVAVPIGAPDEPIVGSRDDDELALVPPDPPPTRLERETSAADAERERVYRDVARRTAALGEEASASFDDFGGIGGFGGSGGGHAGGTSSAAHASSTGHISGGHPSSHGHASVGHGHR
ncbi:MAG TPA: DUF6600 domain-containing protein [Polyangiaceae bacterium]|jgi:hypothetical protein